MAHEFIAKNGIVSQGNIVISGSITTTGAITVSGSIASASYALSASYASSSTSASYAVSSSYALSSSYSLSSSYAANSTSASYALSSSYAYNSTLHNGTASAVFATTGSNNLVGDQHITSTTIANAFTSTASLYTDGGLQVTKDAYFSSSMFIKGNLTIYGTQSIAYITSSQLNIATNLITVNTATPAVRFGGLAVYDSGSTGTGMTGSLLWDSQNNSWIYDNPSGSGNYDSAMVIMGPRNASALGSEVGLNCNYLIQGHGHHHTTSSAIFHDGTTTCLPGAIIGGTMSGTTIYGSTAVCSPVGLFSGCVGIGITGPSANLDINATGGLGGWTGIRLKTGTSSVQSLSMGQVTAGNGAWIGMAQYNQGGYWQTEGTAAAVLNFESDGTFRISTNSGLTANTNYNITERLRITSAGNVGIGTTSPSALLHLNAANTAYRGQLTIQSTDYAQITFYKGATTNTDLNASIFSNISTSEFVIRNNANAAMIFDTNATERMRITSGGSAIFQGSLGICNGGAINMTIPNGNNGGAIRMACCTGANEGDMYLTGGGGVGILIAGSGKVGIGTTTPAYSLSVKCGWIHNYGAQNASGFRYENDASGHVLNLNANNTYAQLYTSTDTSLYFGTNNDLRFKISNTGETCFKCNAYFCGSTYGIMGFGEKVMDKICYIMTTTGTLCVPLDGLTYSSSFPTRAIYLYGTLLDNDAAHYAHMLYFYRNDYGGLQTSTISQASLVHPSTAGQAYTFSVNDPGGIGKSNCTLLLRFTSSGAGVAAGSYCTKMRIVVYNVPGL